MDFRNGNVLSSLQLPEGAGKFVSQKGNIVFFENGAYYVDFYEKKITKVV
jgi:hypothetical protein